MLSATASIADIHQTILIPISGVIFAFTILMTYLKYRNAILPDKARNLDELEIPFVFVRHISEANIAIRIMCL